MGFKALFDKFYIEKSKISENNKNKKVSSVSTYDRILMVDMKNDIRDFISNDDIIVKPSVGQGNYADVPWICLLSSNTSISPSASKGIYIVLLFNKLGNSLFLCLGQGITNFNHMDLKPKQKIDTIEKTVSYFQNELPIELRSNYGFSYSKIDLGEDISSLAKGYILTTIASKKYEQKSFDQEDFYLSLKYLVKEYEEIVASIGAKSYDDVIELINQNYKLDSIDIAYEKISNALKGEFVENRDITQKPILVKKGELRLNKYTRIAHEKINKKTDFLKRAKEQFQTGLKGEQIALLVERNRLDDLGLDPDMYVKHSSIESDNFGYDIESIDIRNGKLVKIFIEVKSTRDIKDTSFFVSKNEYETSKKKKSQYRIFRIFDITSIVPKYYFADGEIEENFYLDPVSFSARYKYDIITN